MSLRQELGFWGALVRVSRGPYGFGAAVHFVRQQWRELWCRHVWRDTGYWSRFKDGTTDHHCHKCDGWRADKDLIQCPKCRASRILYEKYAEWHELGCLKCGHRWDRGEIP